MKLALFNTKPFDREFFTEVNQKFNHEIHFLTAHLNRETAPLARGFEAVCAFVNDTLDRATLDILHAGGTRFIALRSAGYNHIDLARAKELGIRVARVPAYSPHAVAEHAVALILGLNRQLHRAYARVREGNFSLQGLMGFDMNGKIAGVVGTGQIGKLVLKILKGFGCRLLAFDPYPDAAIKSDREVELAPLPELFNRSDILTFHCPLNPQTHHLLNSQNLDSLKRGAMVVNTSRGAVLETQALITGLKSGRIGSLGLDVYEEEGDLFFEDLSNSVIQDDLFTRLLTFPNVLITGHQAFFTREALQAIAETTLENVRQFKMGETLINEVTTR